MPKQILGFQVHLQAHTPSSKKKILGPSTSPQAHKPIQKYISSRTNKKQKKHRSPGSGSLTNQVQKHRSPGTNKKQKITHESRFRFTHKSGSK
jgi:ribosome assembly protein YihI (activator of Der GTPase)